MKKTLFLIAIITLFTNCSKDDDPKLTIDDIAKNVKLSFSTENYEPELIIFSGSVFSVITNNNDVDFNLRSLEVTAKNGDVLYSKNYKNDFITVPKNGGEWLDGKNFLYVFYGVTFKWTIVYNGETRILEHTFVK